MKKSETTKLDKLWREKIKERDRECQVCSRTDYLNAHHVVGRRNHQLRWCLENGIALCSGCHTFKTQSAHQDPAWFMDWFNERYPERKAEIDRLRNRLDKPDYETILDLLNSRK